MERKIAMNQAEYVEMLKTINCLYKGTVVVAVNENSSFVLNAADLTLEERKPVYFCPQVRNIDYLLSKHRALFAPLAWLKSNARKVFKRNPATVKTVEISNDLIKEVYGLRFQFPYDEVSYDNGAIVVCHKICATNCFTMSWEETHSAHAVGIANVMLADNDAAVVVKWDEVFAADDDANIIVKRNKRRDFYMDSISFGYPGVITSGSINNYPIRQEFPDGTVDEYRLDQEKDGLVCRRIVGTRTEYLHGNGGFHIDERANGWSWDDGSMTYSVPVYEDEEVVAVSDIDPALRQHNERLDAICCALEKYGNVRGILAAYQQWETTEKAAFEAKEKVRVKAEAAAFAATLQ